MGQARSLQPRLRPKRSLKPSALPMRLSGAISGNASGALIWTLFRFALACLIAAVGFVTEGHTKCHISCFAERDKGSHVFSAHEAKVPSRSFSVAKLMLSHLMHRLSSAKSLMLSNSFSPLRSREMSRLSKGKSKILSWSDPINR